VLSAEDDKKKYVNRYLHICVFRAM
jgi:hypothetical protein